MQYVVTEEEAQKAKNPHHIFNLNILLTHLFLALSILKLSVSLAWFLLIPIISTAILFYVRSNGRKKMREGESWFITANWMLVWRRGRILIASYLIALAIVAVFHLFSMIMPSGGLAMNNFSDDGSSTPIFEYIVMFFSGALVFFAVLLTFLQTGISVYDCSQGVIDKKICACVPRDANSNPEKGEFDGTAKGGAKEEAMSEEEVK